MDRASLPSWRRRPEPLLVENSWDDLRLGVKCQSNPVIAGSPRNMYRYRLVLDAVGGRALDGGEGFISCYQPNSESRHAWHRTQTGRAKLVSSKGKQPRPLTKVPKYMLSAKEGYIL